MRVSSRTPVISKTELSLTIVKCWGPLKIVTRKSVLDVTGVVDPVGTVS